MLTISLVIITKIVMFASNVGAVVTIFRELNRYGFIVGRINRRLYESGTFVKNLDL